jgi:hypothetical protein
MDGVAVDMSGRDHIANTIAELKGREEDGSNERQRLRKWHLEQLQVSFESSVRGGTLHAKYTDRNSNPPM